MVIIRNSILKFGYKTFLKPIFFMQDPEDVHDRMIHAGKKLGKSKFCKKTLNCFFGYENKILEQDILGIHFMNPVGLAAGFDKDAELISVLPNIGLGFEEIGSITGKKCSGNPKPRLWRLKKSKGLIVYYGLKNNGCEEIHSRIKKINADFPIGVSIAKTNNKEVCDTNAAIEDYFKSYKQFSDYGNYYTINISCPNTYGGEPFTDKKKLDLLLKKIFSIKKTKPIFVKLSPDLSHKELNEIIIVCNKYSVDGFICTNLTKKRIGLNLVEKNVVSRGGISGKPLASRSIETISYIYKKTKGKKVIIGVGGVSCANDTYTMIKNGASLIQMITGMIFEGPQVVSSINHGLVKLLKRDGYKKISDAVGTDVR